MRPEKARGERLYSEMIDKKNLTILCFSSGQQYGRLPTRPTHRVDTFIQHQHHHDFQHNQPHNLDQHHHKHQLRIINLMRSIIFLLRYGAFGVVWSVTDPRDGKRVALKKLPNVFQSLVSSKRVFRELKMMRFFKHENVLSCLDILQVKQLAE